jgi:hypothetical protein
MIGALFYHSTDLRQDSGLLWKLLEVAESTTRGKRFRWFRGAYSGTEQLTRWRALNPANRSQLEVDLRGRVLDVVMFDEMRQRDSDDGESVGLDVRQRRIPSSVQADYPYTTKVVWPRESVLSEDRLVRGCAEMFGVLSAAYGLIYPGTSHADVYMELTSIPYRVLGERYSAEQEAGFAQLQFWQRHERDIGTHVRTAYCGNFLGAHLIAALGGMERVVSEAPAGVAKPLPGGAVYLQVARTLECGSDAPRKAALAKYLSPISVAALYPDEVAR